MFIGAVCQWHTFSTDRSGAETLRELLCSGAIRRHQLGAKDLLTPTSSYESDNEDTYLDQIRIGNVHWQAALVCSDFP